MSVVLGIDLGTQCTVIGQAGRGGVDVILNEASKRNTPTLISFLGKERYLGEAAVTQVRTNMDNTVTQIKRIIGRKMSEPGVQQELDTHLNFRAVAGQNDEVACEVMYNDEPRVFTTTQLLGMFFTKVKDIARIKTPALTTADVVVSVPAYFTDAQRHIMRDACEIAGLNCLRVMNEGTAIALSYGIYKSAKKEFPEGRETKVLFLDMGYAHFTATVAGFTNTSLRILSSVSDADIGSRELDVALAQYFATEFKAKTGCDAWKNRKARLKLLAAAEKFKTAVTPYGVNAGPVSVECLMNDHDFHLVCNVEKLDELAAPYMARMQDCIRRAVAAAGVNHVTELAAVELVGGGMRPRVAKRKAAEALGIALDEATGAGLSTSMNMDEAVARGCALASAMLSPAFRVKPFQIVDLVPYSVRVSWEPLASDIASPTGTGAGDDMEDNEGAAAAGGAGSATPSASASAASSLVLFKANEPSPSTKRITFRRTQSFDILAEYDTSDPTAPVPLVGNRIVNKFHISGIPADAVEPGAPAPRIRIDITHDINGIMDVVKAELLKEIKEAPTASPTPTADGAAAAPATQDAPMDGTDAAAAAAAAPGADGSSPAAGGEAPKKRRYKRIELTINYAAGTGVGPLTDEVLNNYISLENRMVQQDAEIQATQDMRNSLEAYIYTTRDQLSGELGLYATEDARNFFQSALGDMESWLYGEGFESDKATYAAKLKELQALGNPIAARKYEAENRQQAGDGLLKVIESFRAVINNRDGKYAHLSDSDRDTMRAACSEAESWYRTKQAEQGALQMYADPVLKVADIQGYKERLLRELTPIANRPPPAPAAAAASPLPENTPAPENPTPTSADAPMDDKDAPASEGASATSDNTAAPQGAVDVAME